MNAYFTYGVVGWRGTGRVSYEAALTAIFIEGIIFCLVSGAGLRVKIVQFIPKPVRIATSILTLSELLVLPIRLEHHRVTETYRQLLTSGSCSTMLNKRLLVKRSQLARPA